MIENSLVNDYDLIYKKGPDIRNEIFESNIFKLMRFLIYIAPTKRRLGNLLSMKRNFRK